jgi:hypothetical protein
VLFAAWMILAPDLTSCDSKFWDSVKKESSKIGTASFEETIMRKLAREAVIFMLATMVLSATCGFFYDRHSQAQDIRKQRAELKKQCDLGESNAFSIGLTVENPDRTNITQEECAMVFGSSVYPPPKTKIETTLPPGATVDNEPWPVTADIYEADRILALRIDNTASAEIAAFVAPWGFLAGFGIWLFYRLVRFAIVG